MKNINSERIFLVMVCLIFCSHVCHSQQKRNLTQEDYKLWNTLQVGEMSSDGRWVSFSKSYESHIDTLFLKNTITDFQYVFQSGYGGKITPNGELFAYLRADTLHVLETDTGKQSKYPDVKQFEFTKKGRYLVCLWNKSDSNTLAIKNIKTGDTEEFQDVKEYSINPQGKFIAMIQNVEGISTVKLVHLSGSKKPDRLSEGKNYNYQRLTWNASGKSLAYYSLKKNVDNPAIVFIEDIKNPSGMVSLDSSKIKGLQIDRNLANSKLYISNKGDRIFFDTVSNENTQEDSANVQVWKSSDLQVPPKKSFKFFHWYVWSPVKDEVYAIEDNALVVCALTDNEEKALLVENATYLPSYKYNGRFSDVYLLDLKTGKKKKIIEKQLIANNHLVTAPDQQFIAYFKDKNWWVYDSRTDAHTCVTKQLDAVFNKSKSDRLDENHNYGFGGWTSNGQLIVYDEFDMWLISPDGNSKLRMTDGSAKGIRHRINKSLSKSIRDSFFGFVSVTYDLSAGLLIQTVDTEKWSEGFGIWDVKDGFQETAHRDNKILFVKQADVKQHFQFLESSFDISPRLMCISKGGKPKQIAKSNEQQEKFHYGKSNLIHYEGPKGEKLKGALFYPANYDASKKYPIVVSIYENMSNSLHEYVPPSMENFAGFNITNFTAEGYFILLPDIAYTLNEPGNSALKCVLSAIDQAVKTGSIDETNMGLIGHSFGGFETTYIISQTDRFKAAVAGGAVTDLLSFYLEADSSNLSNMERFESEQFRNKIPFTEQDFLKESPIMNVKSVHTPVLLWTGANDMSVNPSHSMKMYSALWRLKKKSTFLIYPNEGHVLIDPLNQRDISFKTISWFNHYLKGSPAKDWMHD